MRTQKRKKARTQEEQEAQDHWKCFTALLVNSCRVRSFSTTAALLFFPPQPANANHIVLFPKGQPSEGCYCSSITLFSISISIFEKIKNKKNRNKNKNNYLFLYLLLFIVMNVMTLVSYGYFITARPLTISSCSDHRIQIIR